MTVNPDVDSCQKTPENNCMLLQPAVLKLFRE